MWTEFLFRIEKTVQRAIEIIDKYRPAHAVESFKVLRVLDLLPQCLSLPVVFAGMRFACVDEREVQLLSILLFEFDEPRQRASGHGAAHRTDDED